MKTALIYSLRIAGMTKLTWIFNWIFLLTTVVLVSSCGHEYHIEEMPICTQYQSTYACFKYDFFESKKYLKKICNSEKECFDYCSSKSQDYY